MDALETLVQAACSMEESPCQNIDHSRLLKSLGPYCGSVVRRLMRNGHFTSILMKKQRRRHLRSVCAKDVHCRDALIEVLVDIVDKTNQAAKEAEKEFEIKIRESQALLPPAVFQSAAAFMLSTSTR